MNANDQLEEKLDELGDALSPEPCIVEAVMGRIEQCPAPTLNRTNRTRTVRIMKPVIGLAACLALVLGVYLASFRHGAEETNPPSTARDYDSPPANTRAHFYLPKEYVDSKWGFIDKTGRVVVEAKYTKVGNFSEGLAAVKLGGTHFRGGKWGFIDRTGKEVVGALFDSAIPFSEGLAAVRTGGKWGFIDRTGKEIAGALFDTARSFSEGLAAVRTDGKWGFIGRDGEFRIPPQFESVGSFHEGLASFGAEQKKGYIDRSGKVVIKPRFQYVGRFSEGLAAVAAPREGENGAPREQPFGYIDASGRMVIEPKPQFLSALGFSEGMAAVQGVNGKWGFIDRDGELVVPPEYVRFGGFGNRVGGFRNGLAEVWIEEEEQGGEKWGTINKAGAIVMEFRYAYSYGIRYSEADGALKGLWGGRNGQVMEEDLDIARVAAREGVNEGLIKVWSGGERPVAGTMKYGFIDLMGKVVIKPRFEAVGDFHEGLAMFAVGLRWEKVQQSGPDRFR